MLEQHVLDFNMQDLANVAWASTAVDRSDVSLFTVLVRTAERWTGELNTQDLTNMAWAFATVGQPLTTLLDQISVLDGMEALGSKSQVVSYQMLVQCVSSTGQIVAGLALLTEAEGNRLLSPSYKHCYLMCHTLLEACRAVGESDSAFVVQAAAERLGLIAVAAHAETVVQRSDE